MRISIDTETEEIQELRHAVAILEDAVKRREDPDFYEESVKEDKFDDIEKQEAKEPSPINLPEPIKAPEPQIHIEIPKLQEVRLQSPVTQPVQQPIKRQVAPPPPVDMSALTMSDRGRNSINKPAPSSSSQSQYKLRDPPQNSFNSSQNISPRIDNKSIVKDIVRDLVNQSSGKPIAMQDILSRARTKNISESETRNLISTLQRENLI